MLPGDDGAMGDADAVGRQEHALLLGKAVFAEGRHIFHRIGFVRQRPHVPGGVQRIARKAHAPLIAFIARKLDHALADRCKTAHLCLLAVMALRLYQFAAM